MSFLVSNYNFVGLDIPEAEITQFEGLYVFIKSVHSVEFVLQWTVTSYFCTLLSRATKLHINFRVVVSMAVIYALLLQFGRTAALAMAHTFFLSTRHLNYLCCVLAYLHVMAIIGLVASVLMMGLERAMAIKLVHSYSEEERPIQLAFLLVSIALALGGAAGYLTFGRYLQYDVDPAIQTFVAAEKNIPAIISAFTLGFVGCVGGALAQLRQTNKAESRFRSFKGTVSLNVRFQSNEILVSSKILKRVAMVYVMTCGLGIVLSLVRYSIFGRYGTENTMNKILTELSFIQVDISVVFIMVYFMSRHEYLRSILRNDLIKYIGASVADRLVSQGPTFVIPQTSDYFQQMDNAWNVRVSYKTNEDELTTLEPKHGVVRIRIIDIIRRY